MAELASLRDQRVARVWLLRIATNVWTDQLRQAKFRPRSAGRSRPARGRPRGNRANAGERALALAAMDELPPRQRQVLYLVTCEDLTQDEVAEVLEIGNRP